jgi:hypothetical protein
MDNFAINTTPPGRNHGDSGIRVKPCRPNIFPRTDPGRLSQNRISCENHCVSPKSRTTIAGYARPGGCLLSVLP